MNQENIDRIDVALEGIRAVNEKAERIGSISRQNYVTIGSYDTDRVDVSFCMWHSGHYDAAGEIFNKRLPDPAVTDIRTAIADALAALDVFAEHKKERELADLDAKIAELSGKRAALAAEINKEAE